MFSHPDSRQQKQFLPEELQKTYMLEPPVGVLTLEGKDVIDFLQRMTTNDLKNLVEGTGVTTIFTNDKGRIIDVVDLYYLNGTVHLVHSRDAQEALKNVFDKYVIMEDVTLGEYEGYRCILSLDGSTGLKEVFSGEQGSIEMSAPRVYPKGRLFYINNDNVSEFSLIKAGKHVDTMLFNSLRIEQSIPLLGSDFDESVNPLEANLQEFISWTKGCYVGQEVIARLDTYNKIKRFLKGVVLDTVIADDDLNNVQDVYLSSNEKEEKIGEVTSIGFSRELQTTLVMSRFERGKEKSNIPVALIIANKRYTGKVVDLPFIKVAPEAS